MSSPRAPARPRETGARLAAAFAVVCVGTLVAPLDSAVNIALPSMSAAFAAPIADIRWVVIAYVLTYASLLLICGRLGDLVGYRKVFQAGLAVAAVGFVACALAPGLPWLAVNRIVQGIGVALLLSCAPALATTLYPESERTRILALYAAAAAAGSALGPVLGGVMIAKLGWSGVFWMRAPIALGALLLSWTIPQPPAAPGRGSLRGNFDAVGAALLIGTLGCIFLGLALRGDDRVTMLRGGLLLAGVIAFVAFVRCELRHPAPIIRVDVFRNRAFAIMNILSVVTNYAAFSILLLVPYYLTRTLGLGPKAGGVMLAMAAIGTIAGSWLAGRLAERLGVGWLTVCGILLSIAGLGTMATWSATTSLQSVAVAMLAQGLGLGLFQVAYTDLVTATLPVQDRGVAGSLTMVTRTIGVVSGANGHAALQGWGEAAAAARGLAPGLAFEAGFRIAMAQAALVLLIGAALCLLALRHRAPHGPAGGD